MIVGKFDAIVNESLTKLKPTTQASTIFQPNPVIRLVSVAIASDPVARANEGAAGRLRVLAGVTR